MWKEGPDKPMSLPKVEPPGEKQAPLGEVPPYVKRIMELEGSGKDPRSSAVGGFIDGTWLTLARENIPSTRGMPDDQVLALRSDPVLRAQMVAAYARDNAMTLQHAGHSVDETNLRLAHWFGPGGANRILSVQPDTPIDKIFSPDVIAANPSIAGKNAGQVQGMAAEQMTGGTLQHQWTHEIPPELRDAFAYSKDARTRLDSLQKEYQRLAGQPVEGSADRRERIAHLEGEIDQATKDWESIAKHPPIQKPIDMWQNFGSAATIVALLGGLLARGHLTAGLNAAGMAMQAITSNNKEQFQQQFKTWQMETQFGLDQVKLKSAEIDRVLRDQKMSIDEKLASLHSITELAGMTDHSAALAQGDITKFVMLQNGLNKGTEAAAKGAITIDQWNRYQQAIQTGVDAYVESHNGQQPTAAEKLAIQNKAAADVGLPGARAGAAKAGTEADFIQNALRDAEEKNGGPLTTEQRGAVQSKAHEEWAKSGAVGRTEAGYDLSQKIYGDETIGMVADSYIAGNDHAMVGMARGTTGQYAMARVWKAISDKLSTQEAKEFQEVYGREPNETERKVLDEDRGRRLAIAQAEFQGIRSGERTAFTRAASLVSAAAEARQFTPQALETSAKVSRTEYPTLNAIQLAVQEGTGNKDVVDFHVANLSLADAFAQVIGRGNSQQTDAARAQAISMLNKAWSEGQYQTAVRRINLEIDAAQKAPEEVVKRFREGFLQRPFAAPTAPVGAAQQPGTGALPALPTITDQAGYDKLPSGAHFVGPDGQQRQKP